MSKLEDFVGKLTEDETMELLKIICDTLPLYLFVRVLKEYCDEMAKSEIVAQLEDDL